MSRNQPVDYTSTLTLTEIASGAWRQRTLALVVFLGLAFLFLFALLLLPNRYVSNAQLLVRLGPNAVAMDPTADLSKTVSLQESRLNQVSSVAALIKSREMIERVAKRVGPDRILEPIGRLATFKSRLTRFFPETAPSPQAGYSEEEVSDLVQLGEACESILGGYDVWATKDAYTVELEYVSNSPFLSHDILSAFLEEYPSYHVNAHQANGSIEFFEQDAEKSLARAKESAEKVRDMQSKYGIVDLGSSKGALRDRISETERSLNSTISDLAAADAELEQLSMEMKSMPERIESEKLTGIYKQSGDLVRQELYVLEIKAKELGTKFKAGHPKIIAIQKQLEAAREIADKEIGVSPQVLDVVNPNRQEMDLAFRNALARQAGLNAKKAALEEQLAQGKRDLVELNEIGVELTQLTWESGVAESAYLETAGRLTNAKQIADLETLQMSDVSIAQPATLEVKKVGPKRGLLGLVGLFLSGVIALATAASRDAGQRIAGLMEDRDQNMESNALENSEVRRSAADTVDAADDNLMAKPR